MSWPDHFPDGCPPDTAVAEDGEYFRLVMSNPPTKADAASHWERAPNKDWGNSQCKARGLSIYTDEADAVRTKDRIPALNNAYVATATVTPSSGKVAPTPSRQAQSHCTWWLYDEFEDAHALMRVQDAT